MIGRRRVIALSAGAICAGSLASRRAAAFAVPIGQQINCRVMRAGSNIGHTSYRFAGADNQLVVDITAELRVKLGFITLFHYSHANTERWDGDRLLGFESHTNNNGTSATATAAWNGSALAVTGSKTAPYVAPPNALGTSYWNPRTLTAPLINTQDGKLLTERMTALGPSAALLSTGATVAANEWRMAGDLRANLWYDVSMTWVGMQYYAHDGSILTYERL